MQQPIQRKTSVCDHCRRVFGICQCSLIHFPNHALAHILFIKSLSSHDVHIFIIMVLGNMGGHNGNEFTDDCWLSQQLITISQTHFHRFIRFQGLSGYLVSPTLFLSSSLSLSLHLIQCCIMVSRAGIIWKDGQRKMDRGKGTYDEGLPGRGVGSGSGKRRHGDFYYRRNNIVPRPFSVRAASYNRE